MVKLFRWILWSIMSVSIVGCNSMAPKVVEDAAPGTLACSVGDNAASRVVQVQVWRGRENGLSTYGVDHVCQRLQEVGQQLLSQGVSLRFEVVGTVQTHSSLGRVNNAAMQAEQATAGQLKLVIVDAIVQCGDTAGYILGCTPQLGRPVFYVKKHDAIYDPTPEWIIWAHEMGHAVALYHPDAPGTDTVPERIMTYMPLPQSTRLANDEAANFAQLGSFVSMRRMHAAQGLRVEPETRITPEALLPLIQEAGPHGVSLAKLSHLDDTALLRLSTLLDSGAGGTTQRPSFPVRTNALVLLAELGKQEAQAYVRQYLRRASGAETLSLGLYGLEALGRGQQRHRNEETLAFLKQASDERFWCESALSSAEDCAALAESARDALRVAQSKP
jgi:hypothetical protein